MIRSWISTSAGTSTRVIKSAPNVALTNENTGMVNRTSKALLVDAGLKASIKEILDCQRQGVIELVFGVV
jgi:hypothetical protein